MKQGVERSMVVRSGESIVRKYLTDLFLTCIKIRSIFTFDFLHFFNIDFNIDLTLFT